MARPLKAGVRRSYRYLLGDARAEAARLRFQARLWDPTSRALFDRVGVRPGWRVLEVGPGQGSLHLALRQRVRGAVDMVEPSVAFRARLRRLTRRDGYGQGRVWSTLLAESDLPAKTYDLIFVRWVFLFLPDPANHVRQLAAALKPGGILAVQDYYRDSFVMIPTPDDWPALIGADHAFFATQGGDASIATRLPAMFEAAGLDVRDITPTIRTGHPGSPAWTWLSSYFLGVMATLVKTTSLTSAQGRRLVRHWHAAATRPSSLLIAPTLIDVVGRKPLRRRRPTRR